MAEEIPVVEQEQQTLLAEIGVTQADMAHKLDQLGEGLADSWHSAAATVTDTVATAKATVATAVHAVQEMAHDTSAAITGACNVAGHVRRHPWLLLGGALLLGVVTAHLVGRRRR